MEEDVKNIEASMLEEFAGKDGQELLASIAAHLSELKAVAGAMDSRMSQLEAAFEASNLVFSLSESRLLTAGLLDYLKIDASEPVAASANLYSCEEYSGVKYRWLGPERVTNFPLPIDRSSPRTARISLYSQVADGMYGSGKVYIDGKLVAHQSCVSGSSCEYEVLIPAADKQQETILSVFFPALLSPKDLDSASPDDRPLCVSFRSLEVA